MNIDDMQIEQQKFVCKKCIDEGLSEPKEGCHGDCPNCGKFLDHGEAHAENCTLEEDYATMNAASDEELSKEGIVVRHVIKGPSGLPVEVASEYKTTGFSFGEGIVVPMTSSPELDLQRELIESAITGDLFSAIALAERDSTLTPDKHVRPWARALAERGDVTLEEWKNLRANSYEYQLIYPKLTDEALVYAGQHIVDNCRFDQRRPWSSYNEACMGFLAPELLKRLDASVQKAEDLSLAPERAALDLDKRVLSELLTCADYIDNAASAVEGLDDDLDGESAEAREHASHVRDVAAMFAAARGLPVEGVEQSRKEAAASLEDMRKLYPGKPFAANSKEWLTAQRRVTATGSPDCCTEHRASGVRDSCCSETCECSTPEGSIGGACRVCKRTIQ